MEYIQSQINTLPLAISCYENGQISISRLVNFGTLLDQPEEGVQAVFDSEGGTIGTTDIEYGELLNYKEMPEVLAWLQAQHMEMPNLKGF